MNEVVQEYLDLIDSMVKDERFEMSMTFLLSVKKTIERTGKITPAQINPIENVHAKGR